MPYIPDLQQLKSHFVGADGARFPVYAVGWLNGRYPFTTGPVPDAFPDALLELASRPALLTRGFHDCNIEISDRRCAYERKYVLQDGRVIWTSQVIIQKNGREYALGNGEIFAEDAAGTIYNSPTLIYHYVVEHHYLPPPGFVEAVLMTVNEAQQKQ